MWRQENLCALALLSGMGSAAAAATFSSSEQQQRPQFHFLPESNWMNDPNAPFYDSSTGLYHLFYQFLTPRTWGHAVSENLVDWSILPMALNYSDSLYTEMPNSTAGVYSGSALLMTLASGQVIPWLSISVPTNDMQLLAYPADISDPYFTEWTYSESNPVIYSSSPSDATPPGRDPTEAWPCGLSGENKWCLTYATQQSEGCPCSGVSGSMVFSALFDAAEGDVGAWSAWTMEGYLLNDTETGSEAAVMWECTDLFPLRPEEEEEKNIWLFKYSIGPGPGYSMPWGDPGPRDYYVTGVYKPFETSAVPVEGMSVTDFIPFQEQYAAAMARDLRTSLDPGAFYASKSFSVPGVGRVNFGWLPEERPVETDGEPYGWAGAMSLPRLFVPYQLPGSDTYYVRTPPLESAVQALHYQQQVSSDSNSEASVLSVSAPSSFSLQTAMLALQTEGAQLDISTSVGVLGMQDGDACGIRLRSSITDADTDADADMSQEFTDVYVQFWNCSVPAGGTAAESVCGNMTLSVDTTRSNANLSIPVTRSVCTSGSIRHADMLMDDHGQEVRGGSVKLRALLDHSVVESFLGAGAERAVTRRVYPSSPQDADQVQLIARSGDGSDITCHFRDTSSWTMRSATSQLGSADDDDDNDDYKYVYYSVIAVVTLFLFVFFGYRARNFCHTNKIAKNVDEAVLLDENVSSKK